MIDTRTALSSMAGAAGFVVLTNAGSPHTIEGLIIGARTVTPGVLVSGTQISKNALAQDLVNYEIESSGNYDPLWTRGNTITVPAGAVKIILGDDA